ncbi:MAG: oligosaccharide flippase family protein [Hyphomicrobiales bacterium]
MSNARSVAAIGGFWTFLGVSGQNAIRLVSTLILTRLLAPEIFGLMSLALVVMTGLRLFSDFGIIPAIVRSPRGEEVSFLQTAWTVKCIRGVGIAVVACLVAWPASKLYEEPVLFPVICALSLTAIIGGFTSISIGTCKRQIALRQITLMEIFAQVLTTAATILMSWLIESVWALVIGSIAGSIFQLILSYTMLPSFPHKFRLEKEALAEIVKFGRWIMIGTIMTFIGGNGNIIFIGYLLTITELGFFTIARTLSGAFAEIVNRILNNVAFPMFSSAARKSHADMVRAVGKVNLIVIFGAVPMFILLSICGQFIVDLLYDPRYAIAGSYLKISALNGAIGVISMPVQNAMLALGKSKQHAFVMFASAIFRIIGLFIGYYLWGTLGVLVGIGVGNTLTYMLSLSIGERYNVNRFWRNIWVPLLIMPLYVYAF